MKEKLILPSNICPECGKQLDSFTHPNDEVRKPRENDLSVCVYCGCILRFIPHETEGLQTVKMTDEEKMLLLAEEPKVFFQLINLSERFKSSEHQEMIKKAPSNQKNSNLEDVTTGGESSTESNMPGT